MNRPSGPAGSQTAAQPKGVTIVASSGHFPGSLNAGTLRRSEIGDRELTVFNRRCRRRAQVQQHQRAKRKVVDWVPERQLRQ